MIYGLAGIGAIAVVLLAVVIHLNRKLASANKLAAARQDEHERLLESKTSELRQLTGQLREARSEITELTAANGELNARVEAQRHDLESATASSTATAERLHNQIVHLEEIVRRTPVGPPQPEALWNLELLRSERTWRHSVAPSPEGESPFSITDNPLRLAVEIEAAALREEVGAFISVRWDANRVDDPARAHLILRLTQELLAQAARDPHPVELVATSGEPAADGLCPLYLRLVAPDDDNRVLVLDPPRVTSDVIDVSIDDGMVVTVR
ncbi:MAG: hypothetical protein R2706_09830 [Acidimicrobiales bacterium]